MSVGMMKIVGIRVGEQNNLYKHYLVMFGHQSIILCPSKVQAGGTSHRLHKKLMCGKYE